VVGEQQEGVTDQVRWLLSVKRAEEDQRTTDTIDSSSELSSCSLPSRTTPLRLVMSSLLAHAQAMGACLTNQVQSHNQRTTLAI
jgi:hypothetical protein